MVKCEQPGHEFVGNYGYDHDHFERTGEWQINADRDEPNRDGLDGETHRVRILAPQDAIDSNSDVDCCVGCAGKLAEAHIGFGWDVEVRQIERSANGSA